MSARLLIASVFLLLSFQSGAEIIQKDITYKQGDTVLKGMVAYDDAIKGKRPGVLVVHEWWGQNDYSRKRAKMLAELGYTALALDMYGNGKTAAHPREATEFSNAVGGNPELARARFNAALKALKAQPTVDQDKIAAIGYCFGGGIVLQMARMGTDIDGVVSFHGSVGTSHPAKKGDIKTRIRAFTGADDPFVKAEQIEALKQELDNAGADYKVVVYPGAKHSFTNKGADALGKKFNLPLEYNRDADEDSWKQMQAFFDEIFSE